MKKRKRRSSINRNKKKTRTKQRSFTSDGAGEATNQIGLKNERIRICFVYVGLICGLICGLVLTLMNIKDPGFSLDWGSGQLKLTLVGIAIILGCAYGLYKFDSKVSIKNEQQ